MPQNRTAGSDGIDAVLEDKPGQRSCHFGRLRDFAIELAGADCLEGVIGEGERLGRLIDKYPLRTWRHPPVEETFFPSFKLGRVAADAPLCDGRT
ncbi:hypothetical protein [Labrys neptuniae]